MTVSVTEITLGETIVGGEGWHSALSQALGSVITIMKSWVHLVVESQFSASNCTISPITKCTTSDTDRSSALVGRLGSALTIGSKNHVDPFAGTCRSIGKMAYGRYDKGQTEWLPKLWFLDRMCIFWDELSWHKLLWDCSTHLKM